MARMWWKRKKLLTVLANRRQWDREFDPAESDAYEIEIEQGGSFIITQASNAATPNYIITE